jgi:hypothetical protein
LVNLKGKDYLEDLGVDGNIILKYISVITRIMSWARHAGCMETRNAHKILDGQPEGKRPRGSHRHRPEDNIGTDLREIVWEYVECMHLAQDRDQWRLL